MKRSASLMRGPAGLRAIATSILRKFSPDVLLREEKASLPSLVDAVDQVGDPRPELAHEVVLVAWVSSSTSWRRPAVTVERST